MADTVKRYETGDARRTILAFVFMILLPFLVSIPAMIWIRGVNGYWRDAATAGVLGALFSLWMLFLLVNIIAAFRTRIVLKDKAVQFAVPRWRGPNPTLRAIKGEISFDDLAGVETRGEIYQAIQVPVLTRSTSLVKKDGERVVLGYINHDAPDPALNYPEIGQEIAARAGVPFTERGHIVAGSQTRAMIKGTPDWATEPITEGELTRFRSKARWSMLTLAFLLFGLAAIGLLADLVRSGWLFGAS